MQELIGLYITMEEYFMRETVNKVGQRTHPLEVGFPVQEARLKEMAKANIFLSPALRISLHAD